MKKLWNMKVTKVPIVIGALGTVTKGLLKGLEDLEIGGRVETIQMTALLTTARILRRVLETCYHSNFSEKPSANTDVKNSKGVNNNNYNNNNNNADDDRTSANHPKYSFIKIVQNTEKSPGDLRRLAVTQTPVKKLSASASGKTLKRVMIIITR